MPRNLKRYQNAGQLHFITFSCYQRRPFLRTAGKRDIVLRALEQARRRFGFVVVGYVVMPEHVHLLVSEPERGSLGAALQLVKQTISRMVRRRRRSLQQELFAEPEIDTRFWQTRYYDFNVWTAKKRVEKLKYMHRNPVMRGLCSKPEDWRWSSYRWYAFEERGRGCSTSGPESNWSLEPTLRCAQDGAPATIICSCVTVDDSYVDWGGDESSVRGPLCGMCGVVSVSDREQPRHSEIEVSRLPGSGADFENPGRRPFDRHSWG
jgi:putative transposase